MQGGARNPLGDLSRAQRRALVELLIAAASGHAPVTERIPRLTAAAPMDRLAEAAALHRVPGTVRRALAGAEGVPPEVIDELAEAERRASIRHLRSVGALGVIARAFEDAGLRWAVMKGPFLAAALYPGIGDRTYNDLDLLVERHDFAEAMTILEDLGYRHAIHDWAWAEEMLAGQVGMATRDVSVDLHWHLHYSWQDRRPFALEPDPMLARVRRVEVSSVVVPTLDPVDTVLTLAFHAARSDGHRLVWYKDLERALTVDRPDLDELVARARAGRCAPPVGLILGRTRELLGAPAPPEVIESLASRTIRAIDRAARAAVDPVQLHERDTITRAFTRSVRGSFRSSIGDVPARGWRWMRSRFAPPRANETDDPDEKASYLRAVAATAPRTR